MALDGSMTIPQRGKVLKAFRESTKPEVLLVSDVGLAGLNLDCANILIIMVSTLKLRRLYSYHVTARFVGGSRGPATARSLASSPSG